ncbi:hypothetical protein Q1W71_03695 [Flavobacterium pectinovorum]|uniref:hypothetical protein n=1 Tax=Flavobacterium pectinovorum TaxID=29533 RepID=UPI00265F96D2|nr:hypothetical protein [Flavobacterium pectinovorum]WKL48891.1 hypothetical protein Q1W71_03695 [Flavobacterium pectinovorum]
METLPIFLIKVLQILADRYGNSFTLEELTSLLTPVLNSTTSFKESISNENQARVLDALLFLNSKGHIFLNSISDKSTISIKGLILINDKVICN